MKDNWITGRRLSPYYTAGETFMRAMREQLEQSHVAVLAGLGGIGKSEAAICYLDSHVKHYETIFWFDASDDIALNEEWGRMSQIAPHLFTNLFLKTEKTLLVLDNIQDINMVQQMIPLPWKGHLILTTRFTQSHFPQLMMPTLSQEESMLLLLRQSRTIAPQGTIQDASPAAQKDAAAIAQVMDGYPRALTQAANHLALAIPLSRYLSLYQKEPRRILAWRDRSPGEPSTLVEIVEETIRRLSPKSQHELPALAASDPRTWQNFEKDVLDELLCMCLIQYRETGYEMHRLVRLIVAGE
jgi:hypothetical protein